MRDNMIPILHIYGGMHTIIPGSTLSPLKDPSTSPIQHHWLLASLIHYTKNCTIVTLTDKTVTKKEVCYQEKWIF